MPASSEPQSRITVPLPEPMIARLRELAVKSDVAISKVVESLLYLDDETIARQVETARPLIAAAKRERLQAKKDAATLLRKLSPEQLAAVQKMAEGLN